MSTSQKKHTGNGIPGKVSGSAKSQNGLTTASFPEDVEWAFAEAHLKRIKHVAIQPDDVVLVAIPMSENSWLEVMDACVYAGADYLMSDPAADADSLAEIIRREKVNVVATTPQVWSHIYRQLNANPGGIKSLRVIRYNDRGQPESRIHLIPAALEG